MLFLNLKQNISRTLISLVFSIIIQINYCQSLDNIKLINPTYLGNDQRNYYGNIAPSKLNIKWKHELGVGITNISNSNRTIECKGAKRTCQPLLINENDTLYIIQGGCNHQIKKINAENGVVIWAYQFDDIINSTGTIWKNSSKNKNHPGYQLIQGSRIGVGKKLNDENAESLRAISLKTGKEIWRFNVKKTPSFSRDVDASCLIYKDSLFIGLENGIFEILDPKNENLIKNGDFYNPKILAEIPLYNDSDIIFHQNNLIIESSPARLGERIYIASASGHIFGYNLESHKLDWDYYIGADIDGSTIITKDSCILIGFEKQYLEGYGGVLKIKLNSNQKNNTEWFFPIENSKSQNWGGGVIGSVGIDDQYNSLEKKKAAFVGVNGVLYVVNHNSISKNKIKGPHLKKDFFMPELIYSRDIGLSVSTPIFVNNKLIVGSSKGLWLFEFIDNKIKLLDHFKSSFESTPVVHNKNIYIASTDGFLYCFGE